MVLRKYRYAFSRIRIVSNVKLTERQLKKIERIVDEIMYRGSYAECQDVSREIAYKIAKNSKETHVETGYTIFRNLKIKITIVV